LILSWEPTEIPFVSALKLLDSSAEFSYLLRRLLVAACALLAVV
jgi:hypothetical protein